MRVPKPTVVVNAAPITPLAVLTGKCPASMFPSCHRCRITTAYSTPAPTTRGMKMLFARLKSTPARPMTATVQRVPATRGTMAVKARERRRKVRTSRIKTAITA